MRKERIRLPREEAVTRSINVAFRRISKSTAAVTHFGRTIFILCQARLREAVKYNYGWLSSPAVSRRDPRGARGPDEL